MRAALFVQNNAIRIMTCPLSAALFDRNNASMNIGAYAIFRSHHSRRLLTWIMRTALFVQNNETRTMTCLLSAG